MPGPLSFAVEEWLTTLVAGTSSVLWAAVLPFLAFPSALAQKVALYRRPRTFNSVFITGASSGIGASLAKAYARPGTRLVLTARRVDKLAEVRRECEARGAEVKAVPVDVTDEKATRAAILQADQERPLDLVIANAGVEEFHYEGQGPSYLSTAQVGVTMTNVMGVVYTLSPIVDRMRARRYGQLVIVSSVMSFTHALNDSGVAYGASKVWARSYGENLRAAVQGYGVGVTTICPGPIQTDMLDRLGSQHWLIGWYCRWFQWKSDVAAAKMQKAIACNLPVFSLPFYLVGILLPTAFNIIPWHGLGLAAWMLAKYNGSSSTIAFDAQKS